MAQLVAQQKMKMDVTNPKTYLQMCLWSADKWWTVWWRLPKLSQKPCLSLCPAAAVTLNSARVWRLWWEAARLSSLLLKPRGAENFSTSEQTMAAALHHRRKKKSPITFACGQRGRAEEVWCVTWVHTRTSTSDCLRVPFIRHFYLK